MVSLLRYRFGARNKLVELILQTKFADCHFLAERVQKPLGISAQIMTRIRGQTLEKNLIAVGQAHSPMFVETGKEIDAPRGSPFAGLSGPKENLFSAD